MSATGSIEVDADRWDDLRGALGVTDVYSSRGYVEASAVLAGGEPVYLHVEGPGGHVLFPALVRDDPVDLTSPYGYGGPFAVGDDPPLSRFATAYGEWCAARGAVSTFVAYHPLHGNAEYAPRTGFRASPLAGTVAWRLEGDLAAGMHRHHRRSVRRAEAAGMRVTVTPRPPELDAFVAVYEQTMRRAGAAAFYLFPPTYWSALVSGVPLVRVDVTAPGEELAASVLGMGEPPWLHYHLGGSTDEGRRAGASHLALLSLARFGADSGYTTLHLGGGVGGREDSLFEFKLRFAPEARVPAAIGKAVHDAAAYERLTRRPGIDWDGFFPAYRARS